MTGNPSPSSAALDDIVAGFKTLSTPEISDALDRLGLPGSALGVAPIATGRRMAGRAFTPRYGPADLVPGTVGDYIDDVPVGHVVVLDNGGASIARCGATSSRRSRRDGVSPAR